MDRRWIEMPPLGPHPNGDIGGDIQASESYCRRWSRPIRPDRPQHMAITVSVYAAQENGRRWIQTVIEFATGRPGFHEFEPFEAHESPSIRDGSADEVWPTEDDLKDELAEYNIEAHDAWDGNTGP